MFLNNHSTFSLRYGTIPEVALLQMAQENGLTRLPLTDINNTSACLNFVRKAPEFNITPILGIDFRNGVEQCYVCLAKNNAGFHELNHFLSTHRHGNEPFPKIAPTFTNSIVIYPFKALSVLNKLSFLAHEYIGVCIDDINKLNFSRLGKLTNKLVVLHTVSFRGKREFNIHRLLRAIDTNTLLSKLPDSEQGSFKHQMVSLSYLETAFEKHPHILQNTETLLEQCKVTFNFSAQRKNENLQHVFGSNEADFKKLKALCQKGLTKRYETIDQDIKNRLEKELTLIKKQEFVSFFLINWKIIQYAKSKNYYHVGEQVRQILISIFLHGIVKILLVLFLKNLEMRDM